MLPGVWCDIANICLGMGVKVGAMRRQTDQETELNNHWGCNYDIDNGEHINTQWTTKNRKKVVAVPDRWKDTINKFRHLGRRHIASIANLTLPTLAPFALSIIDSLYDAAPPHIGKAWAKKIDSIFGSLSPHCRRLFKIYKAVFSDRDLKRFAQSTGEPELKFNEPNKKGNQSPNKKDESRWENLRKTKHTINPIFNEFIEAAIRFVTHSFFCICI